MINLLKNLKKKDWIFIILMIVLVVAQVWLELKMPNYTSKLSTMVMSSNLAMKDVWKNGGFMLLCASGSMVAAIINGFLGAQIAASFAKSTREEIFKKVQGFSAEELNRFQTSSLLTRSTNDVVQIQNFLAMGLQMLFRAPIMAVWAIVKISSSSIKWTMATLIAVCAIVLIVSFILLLVFPKFRKIQKLTDDLNSVTRENITGVRVVRAFNAEGYQENKFEVVNKEITDNNLFTSRTMGLMMPVMTLTMSGLTLAIYWIGAYLIDGVSGNNVLEKTQILGDMMAFSQYAMQVIMSFMMLIMIFIMLPRSMVAGNRINEVLKTKSKIESGNVTNSKEFGTLEFRNVSFRYPDSSDDTLKDISFKVNKGETLAIIGSTGSGKTSLVDLIPRFYDVTSGEVLIDGINVKSYDLEALRNKIGLASQKAVLFKGSVKENIAYGKEDKHIDMKRVSKSLKIANATFVLDDPLGCDLPVSQGGTNFSGGQKQRLSIARTLYKNPEIAIFDDTFSALDYKTDMLVRKSIREHLVDTTIVLVAQRIGTIKNADKIIVLDNGMIKGIGTHEELLKNCDEYREIALSQLSKEEL